MSSKRKISNKESKILRLAGKHPQGVVALNKEGAERLCSYGLLGKEGGTHLKEIFIYKISEKGRSILSSFFSHQ